MRFSESDLARKRIFVCFQAAHSAQKGDTLRMPRGSVALVL